MDSLNSSPIRLLVVDDVEDNRIVLKRRFEKRGFAVIEAEDGATALDLIARQNFDLVLLDIMMPGLDGFGVLKEIRRNHPPESLPVVMVTARAGNSDIVEALSLGANDYVTKPIDFAVAFARVQTQLERKKALQALECSIAKLIETNRKLEDAIAEQQRAEARLDHLSHHDALTGLGNRIMFSAQLTHALQRAEPDGKALAVLFVDLDNFKLINDTLGHRAGDDLLIAVAERLRACVPDISTLARVGSDEFAVIHSTFDRPEDAGLFAEQIAQALAAPCVIGGHDTTIGCSIGIALAPTDGDDAALLLANAHLAMHRGRHESCGKYRFFEASMNERAQARRVIEADLRQALARGEFELAYQPLLRLADDTVTGFEALLRWRHPHRGLISPAEFIPLAEEIGVIVALGDWVLRRACADAARWPSTIEIAVNISPLQIRSGTLAASVATALATSGLAANRLQLEITESVFLDNDENTLDLLHRLRGMGVRISLDDFGTGYSSLSYLRMFPFDKLKIDQSFIRDVDCRPQTMAIVRAVMAMAASLGMTTTSEGVETEAQRDWLRREGCTEAQGYLIGRPAPVADADARVGTAVAATARVA